MLAVKKAPSEVKPTPQCTPNILPCRIHHDGPVNASKRHWNPEVEDDNTRTSYFRGRKLRGREVKVPAGYRGDARSPLGSDDGVLILR